MALAQLDSMRKMFDRVRDNAEHGDGELLTRYRQKRDQDAFGSLVRRHGPMVLGVCRRVLRDSHAAEDAFQATFIVLAKKADVVRPPDRLAPWLYGVAYRTAIKARGRAFRRQQVEQDYAAEVRPEPAVAATDEAGETLAIIDEQLNALPEKYRDPLVLCAMQGLNKAEAAERLGLPEGTVSSRLARAREMLRDRLSRRGVVAPAVAFAALFTADSLQAAVPPALAASACGLASGTTLVPTTVLALSREVLSSMTLLKLKTLVAVAMAIGLTGGGFGLYAIQADEKKPQPGPSDTKKPQPVPSDTKKPQPVPSDPVKNLNEKNGNNNQNGDNKNEKNGNNNRNGNGDKPKPANPDGDKPGEKKPVPQIAGVVNSVDAQAGTITLAGKGGTEKVVTLPTGVKVFVNGKPAKLADVPKGSIASFLSAAPMKGVPLEVTEVRITGASVNGVIKAVDATSITLESEKNPRVFKLATGGTVTVNGKDAKLMDLKTGDKVAITLTADDSAILTVATAVKSEGEKYQKLTGKVSSIDAKGNTITLTFKGDREVTLKLTADAKIVVDGKDVKLDAVPKGVFATLVPVPVKDGLPTETTAVIVSGPSYGGSVQKVDASSITITNPKSGENTIKLLATTKVTINGKDAKATDLKVGDNVQITVFADESGALTITSGDKPKPGGDKPKPGEKPEKQENDD